jgi:hypothetical protein
MEDKSKFGNFKVPKGYFEEFPERLDERLKGRLMEIASDSSGFKVPDQYFQDFEQRLQVRLAYEKKPVIPFWKSSKLLWSSAIAASMALFLVLRPRPNTNIPGFEDLARTEIEGYLETRYNDISTLELAESIPFSDVNFGDVMENMPQDNHILNYLEQKTEAYDHYNFENDE